MNDAITKHDFTYHFDGFLPIRIYQGRVIVSSRDTPANKKAAYEWAQDELTRIKSGSFTNFCT